MALPDTVRRRALISDDGAYRYILTHRWGLGPHATFIMLNPSTADAAGDDATVRRCRGYARRWGMQGLAVLNLYAFRARDPKAMLAAEDPVGPDNDDHLLRWVRTSEIQDSPLIFAWGAGARDDRVDFIRSIRASRRAQILGRTAAGHPMHPLARGLVKTTILKPWRP